MLSLGGTLERLQYAAVLQRATRLPLVLSGGSVHGEREAESTIMERVLRETFRVDAPMFTETESRNTDENAMYTKVLLDMHAFTRVLLVTHAQHMPRAVEAFEHYGVAVIPAPTAFESRLAGAPSGAFPWLPSAPTMRLFREACHEYVGLVWYGLRYRWSAPGV